MVEERRVTAVTDDPAGVPHASVVNETVRRQPSGAETARRVIVFVFGLLEILLLVRIVLLLIGARRDNALVRFIYDLSGVFVAPFDGILHTNAVAAGGSVVDFAAILAVIGWGILAAILVAAVGIVRREA